MTGCELSSPKDQPQLARDILSYFVRNPQAADTLEGVARWRLLEEAVYRSVEDTSRALSWLVSQGFLVEISVAGPNRLFSLDPEKRTSAEAWLNMSESSEGVSG
jgi:hypothetical protein